jgi:hypothetical protein
LFKIVNVGSKRKALTLSEKQYIICEVGANKLLTCAEIAKCPGFAPSSLSKFMFARGKILKPESKCGSQCKKRKKSGANKELQKILVERFQQMRAGIISTDGPVLHAKAMEITLWLNIDNFKALNRWLRQFKQMHDVMYGNMCGESGSISQDTVDHWTNETLPDLIQGHEDRNIFSADETALLYSLMPDKSLYMNVKPARLEIKERNASQYSSAPIQMVWRS